MENLLPTYDIHRHIGGSIRPEIVWDLVKDDDLAKNLEHVYGMMTYRNDIGVRSFYRFLGKFEILNHIKWTRKNITDILRAIVKDIRREGVKYAELRFSLDKYLAHLQITPQELITLIYNTVKTVAEHNKIEIGLFLGLKFESDKDIQEYHASIIDNPDIATMISGIDAIGDESAFACDFYKPIFREWKNAGKVLTIHVGESQTSENILNAIQQLGVHRIGHGIRIMDDPELVQIAIEKDICFEISLTSNWITGVVTDMMDHPARKMFDAGLKLALCTDDPRIFGTTMNQEFTIARMCLGFSDAEIDQMKQNAIDYSAKHLA